ncbi:hypothetical protein CLAIMM_02709 [Cladophialophora immunda]|nr:hypothetical protein CLAIMM_02709 [Cladophialophora immunda]
MFPLAQSQSGPSAIPPWLRASIKALRGLNAYSYARFRSVVQVVYSTYFIMKANVRPRQKNKQSKEARRKAPRQPSDAPAQAAQKHDENDPSHLGREHPSFLQTYKQDQSKADDKGDTQAADQPPNKTPAQLPLVHYQ